MPAIAVHHTATSDGAWDGPAAKSNLKLDQSADYYRKAFAWRDPEGDEGTKAAYKFIDHEVSGDGDIGAANLTACSAGIAVLNGGRGGANIPDADRQSVWNHLAGHLKDADREPPELKAREPEVKQHRHLDMEIKQVTDEGTFEGLLATYNNVDLTGDLIEPGAFQKSIQEKGTSAPLLWQHDARQPIGSLTLTDSPDALRVKGELLLDGTNAVATMAYGMMKRGWINGLSIGYDTIKSVMDGPIRRLKELRLWEGSIVTFPANTRAIVVSVKSAIERKDYFAAELAESQLLSGGPQMLDALNCSLMSMFWDSDLATADKIEMARTSIAQFSDAYMSWLADFLNWADQHYGDMKAFRQKRMERKEGRQISTANKRTLKSAHSQITSAADFIYPLWQDEAGALTSSDYYDDDATTSTNKAGIKSEPDPIHSAADSLIEQMRSLIPAA